MKPQTLRSRILLVEDHDPTAVVMLKMLRAMGFSKVTRVPDGTTAIEYLKTSVADLILCDLEIGSVSGLVLVRMIREPDSISNPNVPIVMMTAHADPDRVAEAVASGVDDFIIKPVKPEILMRCLTAVMERPRRFAKSRNYAGPDRRRRQLIGHAGQRKDDRDGGPKYKNPWVIPPKS